MRNLLFIFVLLLASCGSQSPGLKGKINQLDEKDIEDAYTSLIKRINQTYAQKSVSDIPAFAERCLKDSIFEYWYDTPWDFYGTTEVPRQGKIACGYFVTTTLKHLGLNIDRVYLAQQASSVLIKEVCDPESVKIFTNGRYNKMAGYVRQHKGHIFVVGLDNHVGFIVKEGDEIYFIHSSGIAPYKVMKEKCDVARQLIYSKYFMVGHINFSRWARSLKRS